MDDEYDCTCPLCRPNVPEEVIAQIRAAAASPQGSRMTSEEFRAWLSAVGRDNDPAA